MLTVLVGNIKGGCGKTTLATHIASAFAGAGLSTAIGDCDRQRSSLNWLRRRAESLPRLQGLDWSKDVEDLIHISDIVVVPVLPGAFDEDATAHFLERLAKVKAVRKNKRVVAVVGNRLRPGTRTSDHLDGFFGGLGFPVVARLRDSQIYPTVAAQGSTVLEANDRRSQSYAAEWQPLLDLLNR